MGKTNRGKEVKGSKTSKKFSKRGVCRSSAPSPRFRPIILRACEKNNRHDSFVPVCDLTSQDLLGGKLDEVWQRVLLRVAHFVVRVKIMEYTPAHPATTGELARKRARTCTGMTTSLGEDYIIVSIPAHAVGENVEVSRKKEGKKVTRSCLENSCFHINLNEHLPCHVIRKCKKCMHRFPPSLTGCVRIRCII